MASAPANSQPIVSASSRAIFNEVSSAFVVGCVGLTGVPLVCSWKPTPRTARHPDTRVAFRAPHKVSQARSPTMSMRMVSQSNLYQRILANPTFPPHRIGPRRRHAYRSEQDVATIATRRGSICFQTMRSVCSATRSVSCSPSSLEFELIKSAVLCADIGRIGRAR